MSNEPDEPARDAGRERARRDAARVARERPAPHAAVRRAAGPRYRIGVSGGGTADGSPSGRPNGSARAPGAVAPPSPPRKNKIHSILTALPVLMLVTGLYLYYRGESAQSGGAPILAESVEARGAFAGVSLVRSGGEGRHYLWFDTGERVRGVRIRAAQRPALEPLEPGDELALRLAPTVAGSRTLWAWRVEHGGVTLIDDASRLR